MGSMQGRQSDVRPRAGRALALLAALACACALALGALGAAAPTAAQAATAPTSFKDVPSGAWYYEWVTYAAKNGLMTGMKDARGDYTGYFEPEGELTRAQVATVLWRLSGSPSASSAGFPDVNGGDWHAAAVNYCAKIGVVTGYTSGPDKGRFLPDKSITREELATMVWRYAKYRGIDVSNPNKSAYNKTKDNYWVSSYAVDALTWTAAVGVMSGKDYGPLGYYLEPFGTATRGQAAKVFSVLHRDILTGKVTTPHPHTAQLYVYGSGDGVPVYSYEPFFVYVKSNDAASISEEDLALDATDGSLSDYIVANATYKDIAMKNSVSNVIYSVNRVDGGFVGCVMFKSSGTKTIQLKEDGTVIGTLKVNVSDGTKAADDWMNKVIASVTTSKMNAYEKFYAVVAYLRGNFRYDTVDSNCKDILLAQYETPYWVSYRWDSYTSPAILCKFAEKIGGLSPHNCYYDGVWSRHAYITITWNGKTEYVTVCPTTSSGKVSYSTIDFTKLNNVLHFNSDALVGLKKVAALSDDFEVLSADDGVTYDEVTFDAVTDGVQDESSQATQDGGATFDATQPDAGETTGTGAAAGRDATADAGAVTGDNGSAGFDAVTGDAVAADGSASAGAGTSAGEAAASDVSDAGAADAAESAPVPDATQDAVSDTSSEAAFEEVASPADEAGFDQEMQQLAA